MSAPTPPRRVAYAVLRRVFEHGAYADRALRSAGERAGLRGRERAQAQRLAYGSVQRRGTTDRIAGKLARRPASSIDAPLLAALRLGLYELLFEAGTADHAAVDQAVELAKGEGGGGRRGKGAGLVNAVLRRAAKEREQLLGGLADDTARGAAAMHSIPTWIAELWWRERGPERARSLMAAANRPPRRLLRVNRVRAGWAKLEESLLGAGVELRAAHSPLGAEPQLEAVGGPREPIEAAIAAGDLLPQSAGSAAAGALLGAEPGERVLDLCAAPGIKTTQLAAAVGEAGEVVAVERDHGRAAALRSLCARLGADNVRVLEGDARRIELGSGYHRVLLDAPCSGLGTLASRPDLRWRRRPDELERLAELQAGLLAAAGRALRAGGSLLYSVCTISDREGLDLVPALAEREGLEIRPLGEDHPTVAESRDERFLQLLPDRDGTDGFFFATLGRA